MREKLEARLTQEELLLLTSTMRKKERQLESEEDEELDRLLLASSLGKEPEFGFGRKIEKEVSPRFKSAGGMQQIEISREKLKKAEELLKTMEGNDKESVEVHLPVKMIEDEDDKFMSLLQEAKKGKK